MPPIKPQFIANQLIGFGNNPNDKKLSDVIKLLLDQKFPNLSEEERWEYVEENLENIAKELFIKENDSIKDGVVLNFDISQEDNEYYIKFTPRPETVLLRDLSKKTPEYFEEFCKKILAKLGGISQVTGGRNDGGIDFIAQNLKLNGLSLNSTKGSNILVVGQAKRFTKGEHITETDLRTFVGASVKKIDELKKSNPNQFGIFQPVILAYWTTSDFHTDAKSFANHMGIWYLNGIAVCQLAMNLGIE